MKSRTAALGGIVLTVLAAACGGASGQPGGPGPAAIVKASEPSKLELPGVNFYPESITAASDGTIFVSSFGGAGIVRRAPGSEESASFVPVGSVKSVAGVLVDDANALLYACDDDLAAHTGTLRAFDLATATPRAAYPFEGAGFCNDFALDGKGNLFVTDSFGKIYELAKGARSLRVWSADPLLAPSAASGFGADGIVFDGGANMYVNTFSDSRLLRIPVNADGTAGAAVPITVTPALSSPDGMRLVDASTLLVVEGGAGKLTRVTLGGATATATAVATNLDTPTSVITVDGHHWVTEGQLPHFLGIASGPPHLPFLVRGVTSR